MATSLNVGYIPATFKVLGGGLNSTSGTLNVDDAEASDLFNIDFNRFGSILKRQGYSVLNINPLSGVSMALHWYQGLFGEYLITVNNGKLYKMDSLDGVWDDITGASSIGGTQDSYTKLYLTMDGSDKGTTFTDSEVTPKTVSSLESYDAYTMSIIHSSGTNQEVNVVEAQGKTVTNVESYDSYTVLMLHFDNNFTDSSVSARTVTNSGTGVGFSASSKFGTHCAILSSTAYIQVPDSADFNPGSTANSLSIDCWVKMSSYASAGTYYTVFSQNGTSSKTHYMYIGDAGQIKYQWFNQLPNDKMLFLTVDGAVPADGAWHHIAFCYEAGVAKRMFVDGISVSSVDQFGPNFATFNDIDGDLQIGSYAGVDGFFIGSIDEFRMSVGICRWTSGFTPPVSPYGKVRTNSAKTYFGSVSNNFIGGSGYLSLADSAAWDFSSSPFCVDFRVNMSNMAQDSSIFGQYQDTNNYLVSKITSANTITFSVKSNSALMADYSVSKTLSTDTWYHLAWVRSSTAMNLFVDGVKQTITSTTGLVSATTSLPNLGAVFTIGQVGNSNYMTGFIDEFRVSKGSARWDSNFIPWSSKYGNPYTVTSVKQLGTASAEIKDGSSLYLATSTDWSFSVSNFTVDFWCNFEDLTNAQVFLGQYKSGTQHWYLRKGTAANGNKLQMVFVDTTTKSDYTMTGSWLVNKEEWNHIAFIRSSTVGTIYINGTAQTLSSTTSFGTNDVGMFTETNLRIGVSNASNYLSGYLDELRVSKGIVRWTSNFTPPVSQYAEYTKQDTETFLGYVLGSGQYNVPWAWSAANTTASNITVPTGLTGSLFIKKFQNYCFLANVTVAGIRYPSRVYWSALQDFTSWNDAEYIDISKDDGEEITGVYELADRLAIYKHHSIYVIVFTGDADIPFIVQKTNSAVGCSAPDSIQANENGHIFAAYDGIYFFDGVNSYKLSDRINETYNGINHSLLSQATSVYQKEKNKYWISLPSGTSIYNNFILTWDSFLNAWSKYDGFSSSDLELCIVGNTQESPYFSDYNGYYYRADFGFNDSPLKTTTAINSYFNTNWKHYDDLCDKKGIPHVYIAHRNESNTVMTLNYSYDFYNGNEFTQSFSANSLRSVTALTTRRDLNGRGRFVRIGLSNSQTDTSFRIDGLGTYVTREGRS